MEKKLRKIVPFKGAYGRLRNGDAEQKLCEVLGEIQDESRISVIHVKAFHVGLRGEYSYYRIEFDQTKEEILFWEVR